MPTRITFKRGELERVLAAVAGAYYEIPDGAYAKITLDVEIPASSTFTLDLTPAKGDFYVITKFILSTPLEVSANLARSWFDIVQDCLVTDQGPNLVRIYKPSPPILAEKLTLRATTVSQTTAARTVTLKYWGGEAKW